MNIRNNDSLRDKLAAEYVLGTLSGGARRRLEYWMRDDAALRNSVAEWQDRLLPMAELAGAVKPSPKVWDALARRLDLQASAAARKHAFWRGLRNDLAFWRGLGLVSTAAALIMLNVLLMRPVPLATSATSYVAMLADNNAQSIAVVTGDAGQRSMRLKLVKPQKVAADRSLEVWAISKDGKPHSVGLIGADGTVIATLPANLVPAEAPILAVTLEPKGGSPDPNGPTGPVVFKGEWVKI